MNLEKYNKRQYFLDWLRVLAFAYLIFYHTGMMFVEWPFHIESGHDSQFLKSVMLLTATWRLDLLFLVSGVAVSVMMTNMSLGKFCWQRVVKLFIPPLFAIIVVVAPQPYFEALQNGLIEPGYWQFWTEQYFHFTWLEGMITPWPTYTHMWYVLYLFCFTLILIPLFYFINSESGIRILHELEDWLTKGLRLLWAPYIIYLSEYFYLGHNEVSHNIFDDWHALFIFAYILIIGVLFVRMPKVWVRFENIRFWSLSLALILHAIALIKYNLETPLDFINWDLLEVLLKWSWIAAIIGFAKRYLNFTNNTLRYFGSIVYPLYILHQTVMIVIGYYIIDWGFSALIEYIMIALGTFAISLILIEGIIKQSNILRIFFGLKSKKNEHAYFQKASS
ncbi:MAG: acyltransferase [Emcibacteraceae bacterium]|nr:acyltransferase [Emcibacteraceae bacterium]MDG1727603.1 acyltransferase [Emcibacteraceae bacterium]